MRGIFAIALVALLSAAAAAPAHAAGDTIKIGVLNDQTGMNADLSGQGSVIAARLAAEDAGGAINGHKIEIVFADHQNKADGGTVRSDHALPP